MSTVAGQNYNIVACNMHASCRNAIHFELLYSGFLLSNVQAFYIQTFSCISFRFKDCVFLKTRTFGSMPNNNLFKSSLSYSGAVIRKIYFWRYKTQPLNSSISKRSTWMKSSDQYFFIIPTAIICQYCIQRYARFHTCVVNA